MQGNFSPLENCYSTLKGAMREPSFRIDQFTNLQLTDKHTLFPKRRKNFQLFHFVFGQKGSQIHRNFLRQLYLNGKKENKYMHSVNLHLRSIVKKFRTL